LSLRFVKICLGLVLGLMALTYAVQNLANLEQAHGAVAYVLAGPDHQVYPESALPRPTSPTLAWVALGVILALEFLTALVLLKGAWNLWRARAEDAMGFDQAKHTLMLGAGLGMLVWFGLFHFIGGAVFQQWQTEAGSTSLQGAFWYGAIMALTAVFVAATPDG